MALSSRHVVSGYAGSFFARDKSQAILGKIAWLEAPFTGVTSTNTAPGESTSGQPMMRIRASANFWVPIGPTPNATRYTRFYVLANTNCDKFI